MPPTVMNGVAEIFAYRIILPLQVMSFLFHRNTKKALKYIWGVVAVLVIVSMVLFFAPGVVSMITG